MKVENRGRLAGLMAGAAVAALCVPAHAQTAAAPTAAPDDSSAQMVGEVVVTATRRQESLQQVPMTVDVVSPQQLSKLNIFDFHDVQQLAPGVQLTNNAGSTNTISMRGITYDPNSSAPPAVDLYINEFPIDAQTALTAIYDVGQIEVLRGPQGIFRGRTSPAGSITMTTQKPSLSEVTGYAQASGSTLDAENFQGAVSIPLVQDKLAIRVAGLLDHNRANSVRDVNRGDDYSSSRTESYRVSVRFEPTDTFSGNLVYQYLHSNSTPYIAVFGPGGEVLPGTGLVSGPALSIDDRRAVSEGELRFQNRTHLLTLELNKELGWAAWSTNLGYQDTVLDNHYDGDTTNAVPGYVGTNHTKVTYKWFNLDTRLQSTGAGKFTWMAGGTYTNNAALAQVDATANQFLPLPTAAVPFVLPSLGPIGFTCPTTAAPTTLCTLPVTASVVVPPLLDVYSVFGTVGYRFTDKLRLQAGIRYSAYKQKQQSLLATAVGNAPEGPFVPTINPPLNIRKYYPMTGGASLNYDFTRDVTAYFSWGHSYRIGTAAPAITVPLSTDLLLTPAETSNAYEVGLKSELWDHRISFTGDLFYQKFHNYIAHPLIGIYTSSAANGLIDPSQAALNIFGDMVTAGAESTVSLRLANFDGSLQAAYADAHWDNARVPCNVFDASGNPVIPVGQQVAYCLRHNRVNQVPKFSLTASGEYRFGEIHNTTPFIRALVTYRPAFGSVEDEFNYPQFTNVNLYGGLRGPEDRWELSIWTKNLLDQTRPLSVSQGFGSYPTLAGTFLESGYRTAVITPPREVGVTFRVSY